MRARGQAREAEEAGSDINTIARSDGRGPRGVGVDET